MPGRSTAAGYADDFDFSVQQLVPAGFRLQPDLQGCGHAVIKGHRWWA